MSDLRTQLNEALKESMRQGDERTKRTVRLILAALKDRDIAARGRGAMEGVGEDEILSMLQTMVKQRRDSIALYEQGGRLDLVQEEQEEIEVIERFLPKQMSEDETAEAVRAVIADVGAQGVKDMGRVMAELRTRYAGRMDFGKASAMTKERLG